MSRDKLIILGAVTLGLLGFLVYKQQQKDASLGAPTVTAKDFPTISAGDDIDKISITNGDKGEVVLEKVPDPTAAPTDAGAPTMWELTKPLKVAANQQTVKDVLANLKDLTVDSQVNLRLDDQVRKDKLLDAAHGVHVVAWKGAEKKVDEIFGKSGPAGELIVLTDKPDKVWAAKGYSSYLYTKEAKDFRDKQILKFDDASASQLTIVNKHGTLSFTKGGDKWSGTFDRRPIARLDAEKVKDLLRAYKGLTAEDFGDGKTVAETGLDKPEATLTVSLKDGAGHYEVLVGNVATGTNRWAKSADSHTIYQISSYASDWVTAEESKYQATADAGAGDAGSRFGATAKNTPPKK